jgi:hypothetical protein
MIIYLEVRWKNPFYLYHFVYLDKFLASCLLTLFDKRGHELVLGSFGSESATSKLPLEKGLLRLSILLRPIFHDFVKIWVLVHLN